MSNSQSKNTNASSHSIKPSTSNDSPFNQLQKIPTIDRTLDSEIPDPKVAARLASTQENQPDTHL